MSIVVCTGFSPKGAEEYGFRFLETFDRFWPKEIGLVVYAEEDIHLSRGECRLLWDCKGASDFYWRHKDIKEHCGKAPTPSWKQKEFLSGYSWRQDAVKFFRQCMIPENAGEGLNDGDVLVWLDADIVTFKSPPPNFPEYLFENYDLLHLGRANTHSEIGFWAVRISDVTRWFVSDLAEIYRSDKIFDHKQTHSAYAFDVVRRNLERKDGLKTKNIANAATHGHVWFESPLGEFCDHLKGTRRKRLGFSPERPRT